MSKVGENSKLPYDYINKMRQRVFELESFGQAVDPWQEETDVLLELISLLSSSDGYPSLPKSLIVRLLNWSGCDSVGIRLRYGHDFPYYETRGFSKSFVLSENNLCTVDPEGKPLKDNLGNPVLECMCGNVICGRFDPKSDFFTEHGSFWTNSTSDLLRKTSEKQRKTRTRNRCNGEGYESVALIPLRFAGENFGLLQFNDKRKGMFAPKKIALFERIAANITHHLAGCKDEIRSLLILNEKEILLRQIYRSLKTDLCYISDPISLLSGQLR